MRFLQLSWTNNQPLHNIPTTHLKTTFNTIKSRFTFYMSMYILRVLVRGLRDIRVNNTGACESGMGTSSTMEKAKLININYIMLPSNGKILNFFFLSKIYCTIVSNLLLSV